MASNLESRYVLWKAKPCLKKCFQLDRVVLGIVIIFIWVLLVIPFISYYTGMSKKFNTTKEYIMMDRCSVSIQYNGSVCSEILLDRIQECDQNVSSNSNIQVINENAEEVESLFNELADKVSFKCIEEAKPFLCLHQLGGICLQNGAHILPTVEDCLRISNGLCQEVWETVQMQGVDQLDCNSLSLFTSQCSKSDDDFMPDIVTTQDTQPPNDCLLDCQENFFCENFTGKCVPHCPDFSFYSPTVTVFADVLICMCSWLGFLAGIAVLIVSVIRRKTVLTFPSILAVYETLTIMLKDVIQLIPYFDRGSLYCTSPNLFNTFLDIPSYCILSGLVLVAYIPLQFNIWWVTHMLILYCGIRFPFKIKTRKCLQGVHVLVVIAGLLVPVIPVLAVAFGSQLQGQEIGRAGIRLGNPPTILCAVDSAEIAFIFIVMPNCVLALTGITVLALLIWTVHKNYGIIKTLRSKASSPLTTTEVKLLLVISYFIVIEVLVFTYSTQSEDRSQLFEYFKCEETGVDPDKPCSREGLGNDSTQYLFTFYYCSLLMIPAICFVFVVDFAAIIIKIKKIYSSITGFFQSH